MTSVINSILLSIVKMLEVSDTFISMPKGQFITDNVNKNTGPLMLPFEDSEIPKVDASQLHGIITKNLQN